MAEKRRVSNRLSSLLIWRNCTVTYITVLEARTTKQRTYRFFMELAFKQLDHEGVAETYRIVDVVVLEKKLETIKAVIAADDWLSGYTTMGYWLPSDGAEF